MTGGYTRAVGVVLLAGCLWFALRTMSDISSVSPVHWGLLLPHLALLGFPAMVGTFTAGALLFGRGGARALFIGLAVAMAQAAAVSYLAPEIGEQYHQTVQYGKELIRDTVPADDGR